MKLSPPVTAHHLIADLCVELAEEFIEILYKDNYTFKNNRDRAQYMREIAPEMKPTAKRILVDILSDPTTSEWEKERIHEALILDHQLPNEGTSIVHKKDAWAGQH